MIRIPHLETDVTRACQLSCVGCNHEVPLWRVYPGGPPATTALQVEQDLAHLAGIVHADRWGALGGEPLLHKDIAAIGQVARASGVADRIEVWTNGLMLSRMGTNFWRSFDIVVLSAYAGKLTDEDVSWIASKCTDEGVVLDLKDHRAGGPFAGNFMTLFELEPTEPAATRRKFAGCFFRQFSRVANDGFFYTCCCAPHMPVLIQDRPMGSDGVRIEGLTEAGLKAYLERSEPLGCCSICAGRETAKPLEWREQKDPEAWRRASAGVQEVSA